MKPRQRPLARAVAGALHHLGERMEPKKWDELTEAEKIEALRQELRALRRLAGVLVEKAMRQEHHRHGENGVLLVPMGLHQDGGGMQRGGNDPLA